METTTTQINSSPVLHQSYDVVLVGSNLSTLLSGALLSKTGYRVLLVDESTNVLKRSTVAFHPLGVGSTELLTKLQSLLNLKSLAVLQFKKELAQVISPKLRVRLTQKTEHLIEALSTSIEKTKAEDIRRRLEGYWSSPSFDVSDTQEKASAVNLQKELKSFVVQVRENLTDLSQQHPKETASDSTDEVIKQLLTPMLAIYSACSFSNIPLLMLSEFYRLSHASVWETEASLSAITAELEQFIVAHGGLIRRNSKVKSFITEKSRIVGVELSSYDGVVFAKRVICSANLLESYMKVPEKSRDRTLSNDLAKIQYAYWKYQIELTVKDEGLPVGSTEEMVIVSDPSLPLDEENLLYLKVLPLDPVKKISVIKVSVFVPFKNSSTSSVYLKNLEGRVLRVIEKNLPFLVDHIVEQHSDAEELQRNPGFSVNDIPQSHRVMYIRGGKSNQGFSSIDNVATPHGNLYMIGNEIWPLLGAYGEILTAWRAFQAIAAEDGK